MGPGSDKKNFKILWNYVIGTITGLEAFNIEKQWERVYKRDRV